MRTRTVTLSDLRPDIRIGPLTAAHAAVGKFYYGHRGVLGPHPASEPSVLEQIVHARSRFQVETILADARLFAPRASTWPRWERAARARLAELRGWVR